MNLKKTSFIALIALLSYDSFGASSIVRAGVTPLAQGSVKATSSTGNKSRASLGIGGYSDIGKLRPNRTQTGTGSTTGGSTGGTTDKNTCGDHDKIQEELTKLKETQAELEDLIKDLTQVVADKDQEIKDLRKDLASATNEIKDFTGSSYVTKTDLATRADEIAEYAVAHALDAIDTKLSGYTTLKDVTTEIAKARSSIASDRVEALKNYATIEDLEQTADNVVKDIEGRNFVQQGGLDNAILLANQTAIEAAFQQTLASVEQKYATKEALTTAITGAVKTVNAARAEDLKSYTNTSQMVKFVDEVASQAVRTAVNDVARQGYVLPDKLQETFDKAVTDATLSAVQQVKGLGYVTADVMNAADNVVLGKIEKDYATNQRVNQITQTTLTSIGDLKTQISGVRTSVDNLDVTVQNGIDTAAVQEIVTKTLTDGDYASKTDVNKWGALFVEQFNTYAKKETVNNLTNDLQGLTARFDFLDNGMENKYAPTSKITELQNSFENLDGRLAAIQGDLAEYPSASNLKSLENAQTNLSAELNNIKQAQKEFVEKKTVQALDLAVSLLNTSLSDLKKKVTDSYVTTDKLTSLVGDMTTIKENVNALSSFNESFGKVQDRVKNLENLYLTLNRNMDNYTKLQDYKALNEIVSGLNDDLIEINNNLDVNYATKEQLNKTTTLITTLLNQSYITQSAWKKQMETFESKYTPTDQLNTTISGLGFARSSELNELQSALTGLKVELNTIGGNSATQKDLSNMLTALTEWVKKYYVTQENWAEQMKTYTPTASLGAEIKKLNLFAPMDTTSDELINLSSRLDKLQNPDNPGNAYVTQNSLYKTLANIKYMNTKTPLLTRNPDDDSFVLNDNDLATAIEKLTNKNDQPRFVTTKILLDDYTKTSALKDYIEWLNTENQLFVTQSKFNDKFNGLGTLYAPKNDLTNLQSKVDGMSDSLLTQLRNDKDFKTSLAAEINELYKDLPKKVEDLEKSVDEVKDIAKRLDTAEETANEANTNASNALRYAKDALADTSLISKLETTVVKLTDGLETVTQVANGAADIATAANKTAGEAKTAASTAVQPDQIVQKLATKLREQTSGTCSTDASTISSALNGC
ncbi:MAG: hypothetical protein R8M70_03190 [Alphaproteobacteria bacterium]|nr:hypothetical protein [Alphaproteobacteria bacterium]